MEEDWLKSMEERFARRNSPSQNAQQPSPPTKQAKKQEPDLKLTPEEQSLVEKFRETQTLPREAKKKRLEEILDETLGGKGEFLKQYSLCPMESREKHPDGYHIAYAKAGKPPFKSEIIPIDDAAADIFNWISMPCDYHLFGFLSGASARRKPYTVLTFNPSQGLQEIIGNAVSGYKLISLEKPIRGHARFGQKQEIATVLTFEDENTYASESERAAVVDRLQEAEKAAQLHREGRISREELETLIRSRMQIKTPAEAQKMPEEATEATYLLKNPANFEYINNVLSTFKQPYELALIEGEEKAVKLRIKQSGQISLQEAMHRVEVTDTLLEYARGKPEKVGESVSNIKNLFGTPSG